MNFIKNHYTFLLILIFASALLSANLKKPFIGHHDWNGVWYANIARNFLRYGPLETKFGSVLNYDQASPSQFVYATHYPPAFPLILTLSFSIFGVHEWSARLVPFLASLATIYMIYFVGIYFFDKKTAILAAALTPVLPIVNYFSKIPVHETVILPFVLLSMFLYFKFLKEENLKNFLQLVASLIISHLIHWSGYFVTPLFFISYLVFSKNKKRLKVAAVFPLLSILMLTAHLLHVYWLTGSPLGGGLGDIFLDRLNITDKPQDYTAINFINQRVHLIVAYFTKPLLALALVSTFWLITKVRRGIFDQKVQFLFMLGVFGLAYNILFRNAAFFHDYTIIYALPFLVISAAYGFVIISKFTKSDKSQILLPLTFLLIVLILREGRDFTRALARTDSFEEGVDLGKIINERTQSGDEILVLSEDFKSYYEVFAAFYADRKIAYQMPQPEELENPSFTKQYKLIIAIPSRDTPLQVIDILNSSYQPNIISEFLIYEN